MPKSWVKIALLNLLLAALIGVLLRYAFVEEVSWLKFRPMMHAHSHVAMLGWVYLMLFIGFIRTFLNPDQQKAKIYAILFWLSQLSVLGMLIFFPFQGYAAGSIIFSTLHGLLSYIFVWRFWKDLNAEKQSTGNLPRLFIRTSLIMLLISSIALWGMAPIMLLGMQGKAIYYMAVQFFLHFQFNGWFLFAVLGLFFKYLEEKDFELPHRQFRNFFWLLVGATFLTYALAIAWANPEKIVFWTNSIGIILQLLAFAIFFRFMLREGRAIRRRISPWALFLFDVAFACLAMKILIQGAVIVPYIAEIAYTIRNFVIGFIHLIQLGVVTHFLLGFAAERGILAVHSKSFRAGVAILAAGFIGSELILFLQGTMFWGGMGFLPKYYEVLFGISALLPVGALILLISQFSRSAEEINAQ